VIFPNFQNSACCEKYLKDNKHKSLHLARKYTRIFVLGHHLFLKIHSFPRATSSENCSLLGTDSVPGQIFENISAPNGSCCLFIPCSTNMISIRVIFGGVFIFVFFYLANVRYEMITTNLALRTSWAVYHLTSHPTRAHGINYRPRSIYQFSDMASRLSGQTSVLFSLSPSFFWEL